MGIMKRCLPIAGLMIFIGLASLLIFGGFFRFASEGSQGLEHEVTVSLEDQSVPPGTIFYSDTLRPRILVKATFEMVASTTSISLDGSSNILENDFYGSIVFHDEGRIIEFKPDFALSPKNHVLTIKHKANGKEETFNNDFILGYHEDFSRDISESGTWLIPEGSPATWFSVTKGVLVALPRDKNTGASSLAFLHAFTGDVTVDFEITPNGSNTSALFYFLNSTRNQFVLGSNNDHSTILVNDLIDGSAPSFIHGEDFKMLPGKRYHVRISRQDLTYSLFVRELGEGEKVDPFLQQPAFSKLLEYEDTAENRHPLHIGFALWKNSAGFDIEDFFVRSVSETAE